MGNGGLGGTASERTINNQLDSLINKEAQLLRRTIKLLLLGTAECGKTTVLKQFKILNRSEFSEDEVNALRPAIYCNIYTNILTIVDAMEKLNIAFMSTERHEDAELVRSVLAEDQEHFRPEPDMANAIRQLWRDPGVQACFERSSEYQLSDSAKYFLDALDRIADVDYRPNQQDILRARVATVGIVEVSFDMQGLIFRVFDVGGQRTQRKKWIHCFENVNAIIFIISMADYNLVLAEDDITNRMTESVALFDSIANCNFFVKTTFVLFLNKKDVFAEKIAKVPLTVTFRDYKGKQTYAESAEFIEGLFLKRNRNENRMIYPHQTCGTDTTQVQTVLQSCVNTIISENLKAAGIAQ